MEAGVVAKFIRIVCIFLMIGGAFLFAFSQWQINRLMNCKIAALQSGITEHFEQLPECQ